MENNSNPKFIHLSSLMVQQVYPTIIEYLKMFNMEEVRFDGEFNDWKTFAITIDGKIQFFSTSESDEEKKDLYELEFSGKELCPLFCRNPDDDVEIYESAFKKYLNYCEVVFDKLEEFEATINKTNDLIKRIESKGVFLNREIIFEKWQKK